MAFPHLSSANCARITGICKLTGLSLFIGEWCVASGPKKTKRRGGEQVATAHRIMAYVSLHSARLTRCWARAVSVTPLYTSSRYRQDGLARLFRQGARAGSHLYYRLNCDTFTTLSTTSPVSICNVRLTLPRSLIGNPNAPSHNAQDVKPMVVSEESPLPSLPAGPDLATPMTACT